MENSENPETMTKPEAPEKRKRNRVSKFPRQVNLELDNMRLLLLDEAAQNLNKSRNALIRDYLDLGLGKHYKLNFLPE
jgi:hypothetical protein